METIAAAALIMTSLAGVFGILLALADHFLKVEEDPRLEQLDDMLPGNNCGACGEPGCHAFAERLLAGEAPPAKCTVSNAEALGRIASMLGVEVGAEVHRVARLKCAGGHGRVAELASYKGMESCRAAVLVNGGGRACSWGCLGLGDCKVVCDFDAIFMNSQGLPTVIADACTACGDCVDVCPLDLFEIHPVTHRLFVQCNSPLEGEAARLRCGVTCDACGRCAADAPGSVEMYGGLPKIDYEGQEVPPEKATYRCPTGAIVYFPESGQQFPDSIPSWMKPTDQEERHV